ncbi:unnamed protein product [Peronospora farinosa]|uniref:Uncharacterized protein n=1 Tax=Peronospora farinosa TaxID=134698 RepID=A0AAV0T1R1_9STRA|nr:unnamed protein product [Peronospora farinosa]CAI5711417.1 unnamed protein product [Peronospora farinosa]
MAILALLYALPIAQSTYKNVVSETNYKGVQWLDEGITVTSHVHEWEKYQSFCFYENASLHIRMDPLNSTLQPTVIQTLGQSYEANVLFNLINTTLWYLQSSAWPLRSVFWAWSELRVVVQSPQLEDLSFTFARTPGLLCRTVLKAVNLMPVFGQHMPSYVVDVVEKLLYVASKLVCENCVGGCSLQCRERGRQKLVHTGAQSVSCTMHYDISWLYAQNFFLGMLLFFLSGWLSRSRTFHYMLGAAVGVFFSAFLALYLFQRQARNATNILPGAQLVSSLASVATVAVPVTGFVIMPNLYRLGSWAISYLVYVWNREVLFGIPHLGKIYFAFFAFFGCILVWWYQWGASAKPEVELQDEEEVEEIGNLNDELPPPTNLQLIISRLLKLVGMTLLFYSTSSTEASLLLILLVSITRVFEIIATIAYFWYHFEKPGRHSALISKSEYEKQGQTETEKALAQLQQYLKENPDELDKVREDNEIRLRRFTRGRNHLDTATQESMLSRQRNQRCSIRSYCSIQ